MIHYMKSDFLSFSIEILLPFDFAYPLQTPLAFAKLRTSHHTLNEMSPRGGGDNSRYIGGEVPTWPGKIF